jgi:hypothetical protein
MMHALVWEATALATMTQVNESLLFQHGLQGPSLACKASSAAIDGQTARGPAHDTGFRLGLGTTRHDLNGPKLARPVP